jgi:hypothetical protein
MLKYWRDKLVLSVALVAFLVSVMLMVISLNRNLKGDIGYHVLSSKMFGVPASLIEKGVKPFLWGKIENGWDGQFYYFMANDLLARDSESLQHIDTPAYRYQRIGLPFLSRVLAAALGMTWVSPLVYYITSLSLVVLASWCLAAYYRSLNSSPALALIWTFAIGTQLTLLTGLPDAAADSLLALAIIALLRKNNLAYAFFATLACLTREAYAVLPLVGGAVLTYQAFFQEKSEGQGYIRRIKRVWPHVIPVLFFMAWQAYIKMKFTAFAGAKADGILSLPFVSLWKFFASGITGHHLYVPAGMYSYSEAVFLGLFLILILFAISFACPVLTRWRTVERPNFIVSCVALILSMLYLCFGPVVMMHYSGYLKAANVFFMLAPLCIVSVDKKVPRSFLFFSAIFIILAFQMFWYDWIWQSNGAISRYTHSGDVTEKNRQECVPNLKSSVQLVKMEAGPTGGLLARMLTPYDMIFWINLKNEGQVPFSSSHAEGSVNLASHWLSGKERSGTQDGPRTMFAVPLQPGLATTLPVIVRKPRKKGDYVLSIGLVQEGCGWWDAKAPQDAYQLPFTIE